MVCKDMDTALKVSRTAGHLSCVTIKGDQVSKKGTMTGGYIDPSRCPAYLPHDPLSINSTELGHAMANCAPSQQPYTPP